MKLNLCFVLFLFFAVGASAQSTYHIKGSVEDTSSKVRLANTTICVLNAKDSIMRKFTYAKELGAFSITGLPAGKFILLVSYPAYADYVEPFTLDAGHPTHDFGKINMQLKAKLLHDVLIKGEVNAIKIKGDTTEFNAKAYVIQKNDKVEDLLKQLPGIEVDKDGKITANGQTVTKVLVDGDEFFGDDPTLVTKNLRADMVDKVQLYDKKSDQATFTGVDDGQKTKTINIKLKEDKKNGVFGKLDAGLGTQDLYESQAIYNRFKARQKYSAYFTSASDGKTGLGFDDATSLGTNGNNVQFGDDGGIYIFGNGSNDALDSFGGSYYGSGKPLANSGGLHFDSKWNADKETINANYKVGSIDVKGTTVTTQQQSTTNGVYNTNSDQTFDNYAFRQKADVTYQLKIDTTATIKLSTDGTIKNFTVKNDYNTQTDNGTEQTLNKSDRSVNNSGDQQIFDISALYTKKFKKVGRTFSWNASEAYNNAQTKGYLKAETDLFDPVTGAPAGTQLVDQYKTSNIVSSVLNSNITYSEPFSKYAALLFNYGLSFNNSTADRKSFNRAPSGDYDLIDTTYSNDYRFNQTMNQLGAIFNYKKNKVTVAFGAKASNYDYKQVDERTGIAFTRNFINWAPQANLQYRPSQQRSISVYYNGYTSQPTIDQLQPVKSNNDPLNLVTGSPNLRPAFTNNFSINYNSSKVLSGSNTYASIYFSNKVNAIANNSVFDPTSGITSIKYINLTDQTPLNFSGYFYTNRKIKPIGVSVGVNANASANINYSFINSVLDRSESYRYSGSLNISKYMPKKYSLSANGGPSYTINTFSLEPNSNNNAAGFDLNLYATYYLPKKFIISSNMRYNYTAATNAFEAQYINIWNASLAKAFFKDDNLKFSVTANDMLNQTRNLNRSISNNIITQTTTTGIGRYILFSLSWDFTKFGTEPTNK